MNRGNESGLKSPYFSIIIPVYNVECYLAQCIESVLEQKFENYEIILVDDGSSDSSGAICDQYADANACIRAIHKLNGGSSSARNIGTDMASGVYIFYLDSDDFLSDPQCLKKIEEATANVQYDILLFKSMKCYEDGKMVDYYGDYDADAFSKGRTAVFRYMVKEHKQLACAWMKLP